MRKLFKIFFVLILAAVMVFSAACANLFDEEGNISTDGYPPIPDVSTSEREGKISTDGYPYATGEYTKGGWGTDLYLSDFPGGKLEGGFDGSYGSGGEGYQIQSGQLTCGVLNDAKNYTDWLDLFKAPVQGSEQEQKEGGAFYSFLNGGWSFNSLNMVTVTVKNGSSPVPYASVVLHKGTNILFRAQTDARGVALIFAPNVQEFEITASKDGKTQSVTLAQGEKQKEVSLDASATLSNAIDLMFVIDTTGSMWDELSYLQAEIEDVVNTVKANNPTADIKIALLFYRDIGDEYIMRCFNFESDISKVKNDLKAQSANGGGDYEEAVDLALYLAAFGGSYTDGQGQKSITFNWRENSTKILMHVLDAPPHDGTQFQQKYFSALEKLCEKGIRVVTVASSGVDGKCEYLCRTASLITQGRYVFLTNHSGIGGDHKDPEATEYVVEYLNRCLVRLIEEIHTGVETQPTPIAQETQP